MPLLRRKGLYETGRVIYLHPDVLHPNPNQPRKRFSPDGLEELAASIREHGVLQPLTVRKVDGSFELVSGERRLRAARLAGLSEVPCIVIDVDGVCSSLLALVENLQRKDLDFWEEALALEKLISTYHLSQEEAARKKGLDTATAELLTIEEGLCAQIMHLGPYDDEPATVALLDAFIAEQGLENDMSDTEAGRYNPSLKLCTAICKTLGVTLNDLFWDEDAAS